MQRFPRGTIPDQSRFTLGSNPHALEHLLLVAHAFKFVDTFFDTRVDTLGVGERIVFVPSWFGMDCERGRGEAEVMSAPPLRAKAAKGKRGTRTLFELHLVPTDDVGPLIKDVEPTRSCTTIDGAVRNHSASALRAPPSSLVCLNAPNEFSLAGSTPYWTRRPRMRD